VDNKELFERRKRKLLDGLIRSQYLKDKRLINAFLETPLEEFIHQDNLGPFQIDFTKFYQDIPNLFYYLNPENYRTISAPHMISIMLQGLSLEESDDLLILGAKSGYIAALAHKLAPKGNILILEANSDIARITKENLERMNFENIDIIVKNPLEGMPDKGPWKKILVTGAITQKRIHPLLKQLDSNDGVLYAPIGEDFVQAYTQILRDNHEYFGKRQLQVRFSPLMTQIELDELELITDFDDFEIEIKDDPNRVEETLSKIDEKIEIRFEASDLDDVNFDPLKEIRELFRGPRNPRPPEPRKTRERLKEQLKIKSQDVVLSKLSIIKDIIKDLKREDDYERIFDYLDDLEDLIEGLESYEKPFSIPIHALHEILNQIRTLNIVRKDLVKKEEEKINVTEDKIKVINNQMEHIQELQDIIKKSMKRI